VKRKFLAMLPLNSKARRVQVTVASRPLSRATLVMPPPIDYSVLCCSEAAGPVTASGPIAVSVADGKGCAPQFAVKRDGD
jgi:hypothetical protein